MSERARPLRVLCVSPRFPPANAADCHRIRLLLPHLVQEGCSVEVLAVDARDVSSPLDPWLAERLPADVPVHRVRAWPLAGWGLNGLAQRSLVPLWRKGSAILDARPFDVVFFSTTEFLVHLLGPAWQRRHGVPFCIDLQDPWVNDYYRENPEVERPGGRLKHGVMDRVHRAAERAVVPRCSGVLAVSADYLTALDRRYGASVGWQPRMVATFPAEPMERAPAPATGDKPRRGADLLWRYIGRGGPDMVFAASAFLSAWRRAIDNGVLPADAARFEAIGTSYAPSGQQATFLPIAERIGLARLVTEQPARISYSDTLSALAASDGLVVFGSDDPSYTASKVYPCLLAGRPLVAIFHERSSAAAVMRECAGGVVVTFGGRTRGGELADAIYNEWFASGAYRRAVPVDAHAFSKYTAAAQAADLIDWLRRVVSAGNRDAGRGDAR